MNAVQLEPGIPLKSYFDFITFFSSCEITNFFEERFFGIIEVADKIADSAVILKFRGYWGLFLSSLKVIRVRHLEKPSFGIALTAFEHETRLNRKLSGQEQGDCRASSAARAITNSTIGPSGWPPSQSLVSICVHHDRFQVQHLSKAH